MYLAQTTQPESLKSSVELIHLEKVRFGDTLRFNKCSHPNGFYGHKHICWVWCLDDQFLFNIWLFCIWCQWLLKFSLVLKKKYWSVKSVVHANSHCSQLWRHIDHYQWRVYNFSLLQRRRNNFRSGQPGNTTRTCTGHNGNTVRCKFLTDILKIHETWLPFYYEYMNIYLVNTWCT